MPAIWLIDAYRAGERGQVGALARAAAQSLDWPCQTVSLNYRTPVVWPHLFGLASVAGITAESRRRLAAPWPQLIISSGVRNEPVCRWIRRQSGGQARYVHVGKPWGALDNFDLLVTTPQYRVPQHPNVLHNPLTLHDKTPQSLAADAERWELRFADLPRPWIGVLVGGDSGPYTLGVRAAQRLLDQASARARACGGSLLITTSARTAAAAADILQKRGQTPFFLHRWGEGGDNPYGGILALADEFVVTGDSIAMLSEACATGRPVSIFDVGGMRRDANRGGEALPAPVAGDFRLGASLYAAAMRWLPAPLTRDISLVHGALVAGGRARWLEDASGDASLRVRGEGAQDLPGAPGDDLARAVARIRQLVT